MSKSWSWSGCFLSLRRECFEIEQAIIPYLIFMHAVEYGITEIQNSAGHLKKKKKQQTIL